jgi:hypothetical protein
MCYLCPRTPVTHVSLQNKQGGEILFHDQKLLPIIYYEYSGSSSKNFAEV